VYAQLTATAEQKASASPVQTAMAQRFGRRGRFTLELSRNAEASQSQRQTSSTAPL